MNDEWLSPHDSFYGSRPRLPLLSFLQSAYPRVPQQKGSPGPECYFLNFGYNDRRDCYLAPRCRAGEGRLFARRHLAPPGSNVNRPDPGCANRTAEGYLRPHVAVCARCRAISCTLRRSASSRTGSDATATAYTSVELSGFDPPAR